MVSARITSWLLAAALAPATLSASYTLKYLGAPDNNTVTVALTSGSNATYYTGPYNIQVTDPFGYTTQALMVCDNFDATVPSGTWQANRSTFADLSGTRFFGVDNSVLKYKAVAFLTSELLLSTDKNLKDDLQVAIWSIFDNTGVAPTLAASSITPTRQALIDNAYLMAGTLNDDWFTQFAIYTPTGSPNSQEFIVRTPEAAAFAMLLLNLAGVALLVRKLRQRASLN